MGELARHKSTDEHRPSDTIDGDQKLKPVGAVPAREEVSLLFFQQAVTIAGSATVRDAYKVPGKDSQEDRRRSMDVKQSLLRGSSTAGTPEISGRVPQGRK